MISVVVVNIPLRPNYSVIIMDPTSINKSNEEEGLSSITIKFFYHHYGLYITTNLIFYSKL